ncbi:hypothetical protein AV656_15045 [Bhargavaea cecembensis]|uniref:UvrD-like helicase ATP-binding domain-containing protein n=1 Tax=Bhargavaea cecembensis TaxID=394098 RepID=A0A163EGN5_9BACL|nr:UvrD-helicase domain-containing protein [Bhargavaea cecembensis]KZE36451.1 hypothetical protein AV656_15045 [Bhargavaea cecembensis]
MRVSDHEIRNEIVNSGIKNIVISASAGCGKTTILIDKIRKTIDEINNHKTIAAITFTIKATKELRDRTKSFKSSKEIVICTNDSFVENEIIRPFIVGVFGEEYREDFVVDYYKKFQTKSEGLALLKQHNILGVYNNIKENFKFELACYILKNSVAAQQYLISKYLMLFLDEYQDSDQFMHELFMYINRRLNIPLFIVGDSKQAIYIWRGAKENIFNEFDETFDKYELFHNFRSHENITNFANIVHLDNYLDNKSTELIEEVNIGITDKSFNEAVYNIINNKKVELNDEITIIINANRAAEECKKYLNYRGYDFEFIPRTPIDEGVLNSFVLRNLMKLTLCELYNVYNFMLDLNLELKREKVKELEKQIGELKEGNLDLRKIKPILDKISGIINIDLSDIEIIKFLETLTDAKYHVSFVNNEKKHKIMTVFGAKGLEFEQVIIRAADYTMDSINNINNHYVALTRAKNKVVIIDNTHRYTIDLIKRLKAKRIEIGKAAKIFRF